MQNCYRQQGLSCIAAVLLIVNAYLLFLNYHRVTNQGDFSDRVSGRMVPNHLPVIANILNLSYPVHGSGQVLHLQCFFAHCLIYNDYNWRSFSRSFDARFRAIFHSPQVTEFISDFTSNCSLDRPVFAGFLFGEMDRGFGSVVNNAWAAYQVALMSKRQFKLFQLEWAYGWLTTFFEDFGAIHNCPVYRSLSRQDTEFFATTQENYTLSYADSTVRINTTIDVAPIFPSTRFREMQGILRTLFKQDPEGVFQTRSLLARATWQLRPELYNFVKVLLSSVRGHAFIGVHVRRTDKISSREMGYIPISRYAKEIHDIAQQKQLGRCAIYIMTDDHSAFDELSRLLENGSYIVYSMEALIRQHRIGPLGIFRNSMAQVNHSVPSSDREYWASHTAQIILEMTILTLADEVICTMTSNICRLLALLRGDRSEAVHSLDISWHPI